MDIDTSDIRAGYVRSEMLAPYWSDERERQTQKTRTEFDQWLAEHDRKIKAIAWDQGFADGVAYQVGNNDSWHNPYRGN